MTVDGHQLVVDGYTLVHGFFQVPVHYVNGVLDLLQVVVDGVLLKDQRLLDSDQVKGVLADGVDFGCGKRISFLPKKWTRERY